jgi:hypothetical protein
MTVRAHNPKVVSSNLTPATNWKFICKGPDAPSGLFSWNDVCWEKSRAVLFLANPTNDMGFEGRRSSVQICPPQPILLLIETGLPALQPEAFSLTHDGDDEITSEITPPGSARPLAKVFLPAAAGHDEEQDPEIHPGVAERRPARGNHSEIRALVPALKHFVRFGRTARQASGK